MRRDETETALLETRGLTVRFGGHVAVDGVSCRFREGELTAIVGPNGAGKTTYFNLVSGQIRASAGRVLLEGRDVTRLSASARTRRGMGRAFQLTNLFPGLSVLENVRLAMQAREGRGFRMFSRAMGDWELLDEAERLLQQVRLLSLAEMPVTALSHGDQRKLEVALLMALEPRVFMFDEPTAGMSADEAPHVLDLVAGLKGQPGRTVLLVEHKMDVIRELADRIIVLHNGVLLADGPPDEVMDSEIVQEVYMGQALTDV
ncbi:ATP-binding cassette domain-containing protein [Mangrovicoccus sp. HB161399]|uniref:ABC transporter ATP-binding protein n=1 Tax=Mangrovicoccus sp. HB161399 TaxID=2720392 RepID=UPI00155788CC